MKQLFILFCVSLFSFHMQAQLAFKESAKELNVEHHFIQWTVGGGVSFFDFNQDGLDDLTLSTTKGRRISFYINTGTGFELIPPLVDNVETVKQILWMDYDNDGDYDLYVAAFDGINRLYQQKGDLVFVEVTEIAGLPMTDHRGYGACFGDYNRDGWLDLYYNSRSIPGSPNFKNTNRLFRNNADGTFTETTAVMEAGDEFNVPFSSAFLDFNNDNWPDLYTSNDKYNGNTLLENKGGEIYEDVSVATNTNLTINGMCVTTADYNKDGWTDIYVTNTHEGNKFLVNTGGENEKPVFKECATPLGVEFFNSSWGSNFIDADNDGDLDLYVSGSEKAVIENVSSIFYENINSDFFEIPFISGFAKDTAFSFSNAIGDYNNDGKLDIIVQNNPPFQFHFWENKSQNNNKWVKIKLEGVLSNRDGIGTKIESYHEGNYQSFYTQCGLSFLGQNSASEHIGIGQSNSIDSLVITWPTGHIDRYYDITPNQILSLKEGGSTEGIIKVDENISIVERGGFISTSTEEINYHQLILQPNPVIDFLLIESVLPFTAISIVDMQGHYLSINNFDETTNITIDVENYPAGIYLIRIADSKNRVSFKKWIKF